MAPGGGREALLGARLAGRRSGQKATIRGWPRARERVRGGQGGTRDGRPFPQQSPFASAGWDCWPRLRRWASAAAAGWWSARWWARGPLLQQRRARGARLQRLELCPRGHTRVTIHDTWTAFRSTVSPPHDITRATRPRWRLPPCSPCSRLAASSLCRRDALSRCATGPMFSGLGCPCLSTGKRWAPIVSRAAAAPRPPPRGLPLLPPRPLQALGQANVTQSLKSTGAAVIVFCDAVQRLINTIKKHAL